MEIIRIEAPPDPDGSEGLLGLIVRGGRTEHGTQFVTDESAEQQVGVLSHRRGWTSSPHRHYPHPRGAKGAGEVLVVLYGALLLKVYDSANRYVYSATLHAGDVYVYIAGGHAFRAFTDFEAVEVKQGPHRGEESKSYFTPTA